MNNRATAEQTYGNNLHNIPIITNMNTGFRGPRGINRSQAVNVGRLNSWIKDLAYRGGILADRPLATYTLPGSHDALTFAFKGNIITNRFRGGVVTQKLNLLDQFNTGVRYFDIRVKEKKGKLYGFHGGFTLDVDAEQAIRELFLRSVQRREPIVIKFDYKGNAFPIVKRVADEFSNNILPTEDYWKRAVGDCIDAGRVLCLFHKVKAKHREKWGDDIDLFGDYSRHKAGGFSNKHNMQGHQKYLGNLASQRCAPDEEKLKVMSLNIPSMSTHPKQIGAEVFNALLLFTPELAYLAGQKLRGTPEKNRWIGFYRSVGSIEEKQIVKDINIGFVKKLTDLVDSWYAVASEYSPTRIRALADEMTYQISGAVGMDFVGTSSKRALILNLVELNNRDF